MAQISWSGIPGLTYTYDDTEPTIKDQIRGLIGDISGQPVAYLSDGQINSIAASHSDDLYTAAAECADSCASRTLSLYQEVQQGSSRHGLRIKNFDLAKIYAAWVELGMVLRNKSTNVSGPSYGTLSGKIDTSACESLRGWGW